MLERASSDWPQPGDEAILREAAHWVRKLNGHGLTTKDKEQLKSWLELDARHASALDLTMEAWEKSPDLLGGLGYEAATAPSSSNKTAIGWALGGLASACAAVLAFFVLLPPTEIEFTNAIAGDIERSITLADGSDVNLQPGSEIAYAIGDEQREVQLLSGAARFSVQSAETPFTVATEEIDIVVTGTEFTVTRGDTAIGIELHEGEIELSVLDEYQATLSAGNRAIYDRRKRHLEVLRRPLNNGTSANSERARPGGKPSMLAGSGVSALFDAKDSATGQAISFTNRRLDDVVAELEVAAGISVSLASGEFANTRVTGSVSIDAPLRDLSPILADHRLEIAPSAGRYVISPSANEP